jgi:hypothetical protein
MANSYNSLPILVDTDISTGWRANQTLSSNTYATGLRIVKIALVVSSATSSSGTVTITDPNDNTKLYPPLQVAAGVAQNAILYTDNLDSQSLQWRDFNVTGVTATGTRLFIWYRA